MKAARAMAMALADCTCQLCGAKVTFFQEGLGGFKGEQEGWHLSTNPLQIHHIDGNNKNNMPNNLILCCFECHKELHNGSEHGIALLEWYLQKRREKNNGR